MLTIKNFTFSPFQENTYVLFNEQKKGIIIDPGCFDLKEQNELMTFLKSENIVLERLLLTHGHIDHILGNHFINQTFQLLPEMHKTDLFFIEHQMVSAQKYGIPCEQSPMPKIFLNEGDSILFYEDELKVLFTPGHSPGSISFHCPKQGFIISGDVLFSGSIGRTDLPGGNHELLLQMVREKLFTLDGNTQVFSGHGPVTSIEKEKSTNPFF
jgi:hydroxyacylglutathione hydrolase